MKLKNLAIVAHVDHGKTTLVDELLKQTGVLDQADAQDRVMDSGELEKERGITITAKNCSLSWNDHKINLLDTPGHADFGGEVERSLTMVDGVLLLVDAAEGPLPQTRFVLGKAMEQSKKIGVFINKIDRSDQRADEVKTEVEDLLLEIAELTGVEDFDLDVPFFYGSGRDGYCATSMDGEMKTLNPLLDFFTSDFYPLPKIEEGPVAVLVSNLSYSPYLGQQAVGRITSGEIKVNQQMKWIGAEKSKNFKVSSIEVFQGLGPAKVESAQAGEIVIISGLPEVFIGDTITDPTEPRTLERLEVEPPTVSVHVSVNTSPTSGKEGEYLTSRRLEEFLQAACRKNVSLQYVPTDDPKVFELKARGELQVSVVFEEIRRAGYELMIARPQVLEQEIDGVLSEPFERVVLDVPNESTGTITETLAKRKGIMEMMAPLGDTRTRMEFEIPSRGLIGYRSDFLTSTKGEGLMSSYFLGYRPHVGKMLSRTNGALISDRGGKTTPYALYNLLSSGRQFVKPGEEVYEGMIVGEHTRGNDLNINVVREKHVSAVRTAGKDENIILPPPVARTLDFALGWIDSDEWVEVTPKNVRIRKKILKSNERSVKR